MLAALWQSVASGWARAGGGGLRAGALEAALLPLGRSAREVACRNHYPSLTLTRGGLPATPNPDTPNTLTLTLALALTHEQVASFAATRLIFYELRAPLLGALAGVRVRVSRVRVRVRVSVHPLVLGRLADDARERLLTARVRVSRVRARVRGRGRGRVRVRGRGRVRVRVRVRDRVRFSYRVS